MYCFPFNFLSREKMVERAMVVVSSLAKLEAGWSQLLHLWVHTIRFDYLTT